VHSGRHFAELGVSPQMAKNIVLCCDGTANEFAKNRTNVIKLYSTLVHDSLAQITYYHPGIGTMEPFGALSPLTRRFTRLLGMAVGYGLENDLRDAYVFLMQFYEPDDSIYLFGFSRGAFTVRAVASLLKIYGMIRKGNEALVPYAIRMLMGIQAAKDDQTKVQAYFDLASEFNRTMSCSKPRIRFVGVWDTVSSVGWVENPLHLPYESSNPDIEIGRHAISIDERRAFFRSHLWLAPKNAASEHGPQDMLQVWFPGVHCDVGGGYREARSGLSKYALEWMLEEAKAAGLRTIPEKEQEVLGRGGSAQYVAASPDAPIHKSLTGAWKIAEFIPKRHWNWKENKWEHRMNLFRWRTIPPGSWVHESAYLRGGDYAKRLPADARRVSSARPAGTQGEPAPAPAPAETR
jgi:uncharacterized protein (DUF2235 family)